MRSKLADRTKAEKLRREGLSYSEIRKYIPVAKSSLSLWLRNLDLTAEQKKRLELRNTIGQKAGAKARHKQKVDKLRILKAEIKREIPRLINDPFFVMGLSLYWAEGSKQKASHPAQQVSIANTDPRMLLIMREWFKKYFKSTNQDFGYRLHIHESANVGSALQEWADILNIKKEQFSISLKRHKVTTRHVSKKYIGLVHIKIYKSTWHNRRIELWTQEVADYYLSS